VKSSNQPWGPIGTLFFSSPIPTAPSLEIFTADNPKLLHQPRTTPGRVLPSIPFEKAPCRFADT